MDLLLEKAYKNRKIDIEEVDGLSLQEDEYNIIISKLKEQGIEIVNRNCEMLNKQNFEYDNDILRQYILEVRKIPKIQSEDMMLLFEEYNRTRNEQIKEKIITLNLGLVISIARAYAKRKKVMF